MYEISKDFQYFGLKSYACFSKIIIFNRNTFLQILFNVFQSVLVIFGICALVRLTR